MAADPRMPILVVEDSDMMQDLIRKCLKRFGFCDVSTAFDGSEALAAMRGRRYGLVISDWTMEPMSGYQLLREIRADPNLRGTPFIMLTGEARQAQIAAVKEAGASTYLIKPFVPQMLKAKIDGIFRA
ncbi:MAG TPA: response regulator [Microvirga sp.]|nr:response regulator [Microvirga sp.]